jgi:hypothetical protein
MEGGRLVITFSERDSVTREVKQPISEGNVASRFEYK